MWVIGPWKDFLLFFPAVWGSLIFIIIAQLYPHADQQFPWRLLTLINSIHTGLPIAYSLLFFDSLLPEKRRKLLLGSILLLLLCISSWYLTMITHHYMTIVVPTLFVLVATYHFYRQDLGVCSMYRSKDLNILQGEVRFERFLIFFGAFLIPTLYWLGSGTRYHSLLNSVGGKLQLDEVLIFLRYAVILLFAGYIMYQLFYKKNFNPRFLYLFGICLFACTMLSPGLFISAYIIQYLSRIFTHDWVEIGFQTKLLKSESKVVANRYKVLGCLLITAGIAYFFDHTKVTYRFLTAIQSHGGLDGNQFFNYFNDPHFQIWTTSYFFASAYHYYVGRYIYDFSHSKIREKLSFGA
jgi:hypothetical protein